MSEPYSSLIVFVQIVTISGDFRWNWFHAFAFEPIFEGIWGYMELFNSSYFMISQIT